MARMKIAYDISVLGMGHRYPRARTGIFRVVENVAYGLAGSKECELALCVARSYEALGYSLDYLSSNVRLGGTRFLRPRLGRTRTKVSLGLDSLNDLIGKNDLRSGRSLVFRATREALYQVFKLIDACGGCEYPLDAKHLARAQIFHSPFDPLPRRVKELRN